MWVRVAQEFLIAFLMGSVPILIAYGTGGVGGVGDLLKASMPIKPILIYWMLLIIPYFLIVVVDHFVLKRTDATRSFVRFLRITMKEVGPALLSLWRVMAGYLLMLPGLWIVVEPETFVSAKVAAISSIGAVLLFEAIAMSAAMNYFDEKWNRRWSALT